LALGIDVDDALALVEQVDVWRYRAEQCSALHRHTMSAISTAFGGKADMPSCTAHVCFWPKADIGRIRQKPFGARAV